MELLAKYKDELYRVETLHVYDEYISLYKNKSDLHMGGAIKAPIAEVELNFIHPSPTIL